MLLTECCRIEHKQENGIEYLWFTDANGWERVAKVVVEWWDNDWVSCHDLEVIPRYRGIGMGDQVVEFVKQIGVNHLSVDPNNRVAVHLYKKHGFTLTQERDGCFVRMALSQDNKQ